MMSKCQLSYSVSINCFFDFTKPLEEGSYFFIRDINFSLWMYRQWYKMTCCLFFEMKID